MPETSRLRTCLVGLLLLALLPVVGGCGGCGALTGPALAEPVRRPPEDETPPPPPKPAVAAAPVALPPEEKPVEPPKPPEPPPRPVDFTLWTPDDYLAARDERDARFAQAVTSLIKTSPKSDDTLRLLVQVLEIKPAEPLSTPAGKDAKAPVRPPLPSLAPAIISFLAASESPLARPTLEHVLRGTLKTDLPPAQATEVVLKALCQTSPPRFDDLLVAVLTEPHKWRSDDDAELTRDALHQQAVKLIQPVASPVMRARLAEQLVKPTTPASHRERLGAWLAAPDPRNLLAQVVLHNSELLSRSAKTGFRETFARLNTQALDQLLGASPASRATATTPGTAQGLFIGNQQLAGGAAEKPKTDDERAVEWARLFWSQAFTTQVAGDLERMVDLGVERELMLLASNLPCDVVRQQLHRALQRQWTEGFAPFQAARLTVDAIRDPGFLLLVKSMPREDAKPAAANAPKPSAERLAKQAWLAASEGFVQTLNKRFYEAARGRPRAVQPVSYVRETASSPGVATPGLADELPLALHKGAAVAAEYHLSWPAALKNETVAAYSSPLTMHYVRIEGEDRFTKLCEHYKRQLAGSVTRTTTKGQWLDLLQAEAGSSRLRSVDVTIARDDPPPRSATAAENLVVEILWIEINDPR